MQQLRALNAERDALAGWLAGQSKLAKLGAILHPFCLLEGSSEARQKETEWTGWRKGGPNGQIRRSADRA